MAEPSLPPEVEAQLARISRDMHAAWSRIKAEEEALIRAWPGAEKPVRVARLRDMALTVTDLMTRIENLVTTQVPPTLTMAYEIGAWGTALQAGTSATFTAVDIDAVVTLANSTMSELLTATHGVRESTKGLIREMAREQVLGATYTGLTAEQAGIQLAADLVEHEIRAVVYANGNHVGVATYSDMVMRTETALAYQEGGFQQGRELGITWWEIMDGPDCGLSYHDDPTLADGMIVDTVTAEKFPISHPNCVRVTSPRPDIETRAQAQDARPTPTAEQRADQAAASRAREAARARVPRSRSLTNQVNAELQRRAPVPGLAPYLPRPLSAAEQRHAQRLGHAAAASA